MRTATVYLFGLIPIVRDLSIADPCDPDPLPMFVHGEYELMLRKQAAHDLT
jgi:hypothetical protein